VKTELLAQLLEVTSVGVAQRALKNPVEVPRPGHVRPEDATPETWGGPGDTVPSAAPDAYAQGISLLAATTLGRSA
jgi:hypothetical protein